MQHRMRHWACLRPWLTLAILAAVDTGTLARACDVCAIYTATEQREARTGWRLGVAEQYSHFATWRRDGDEVPNPGEYLDSSQTQVVIGYTFPPSLGVQVTLPLIVRQFRRLEAGRLRSGNESGVGDLAIVGRVTPYSVTTETGVVRLSLLGGMTLPSGDSGRLAEEEHEHAGEESGVHGHDLALGTGSVDGLFGGSFFASRGRYFLTFGGQYRLHTPGAFSYTFADEIAWQATPGVFLLLDHAYSLALQASFSGETKGKDRTHGSPAEDTGLTTVYGGPGISVTWGTRLVAELVGEIPLYQHTTSLQITPDFRLRGGVTWQF